MRKKSGSILVSGASRGIGKSIAEHFAKEGWDVILLARTGALLDELEKRWSQQYPDSRITTYAIDLSDATAFPGLQQWIHEQCPTLDVLVHNLGVFIPGDLLAADSPSLDQLINLNALSADRLLRVCLPVLKHSQKAQMITIGSVSTTDWPVGMNTYVLSKQLQENWHRAVSRELQTQNIRCTLIRPGATFTSSWDGVEVDPTTLLQPQQVADQVWSVVQAQNAYFVEELVIRPKP